MQLGTSPVVNLLQKLYKASKAGCQQVQYGMSADDAPGYRDNRQCYDMDRASESQCGHVECPSFALIYQQKDERRLSSCCLAGESDFGEIHIVIKQQMADSLGS